MATTYVGSALLSTLRQVRTSTKPTRGARRWPPRPSSRKEPGSGGSAPVAAHV